MTTSSGFRLCFIHACKKNPGSGLRIPTWLESIKSSNKSLSVFGTAPSVQPRNSSSFSGVNVGLGGVVRMELYGVMKLFVRAIMRYFLLAFGLKREEED